MRENLVEIEEDLQYINIASSKNKKEHGLIRLILSCMADAEEISNLTPRDIIEKKVKNNKIQFVYLKKGRMVRKFPVDGRTYLILKEISSDLSKKSKIFEYTPQDIDCIIKKYSPETKKYNLRMLLKSVKSIISDNLLGTTLDEMKSMNIDELWSFMQEFHPMFSGMWDLERDDVAFDYFQMLAERHGISSYTDMAEISGESEERIRKLMKRKWFLNYMDS